MCSQATELSAIPETARVESRSQPFLDLEDGGLEGQRMRIFSPQLALRT
jgi:hypothetical protein